jgi:hypothetical protein
MAGLYFAFSSPARTGGSGTFLPISELDDANPRPGYRFRNSAVARPDDRNYWLHREHRGRRTVEQGVPPGGPDSPIARLALTSRTNLVRHDLEQYCQLEASLRDPLRLADAHATRGVSHQQVAVAP